MEQVTSNIQGSTTDAIIFMAPWLAGAIILILGYLFRDLLQDFLAGILFLARKSISRDTNLIIYGQEARVVQVGLFTTTLFIYNSKEEYPGGRYEEIANSKIKKERYQVLAPLNQFQYRRDIEQMQKDIEALKRKVGIDDKD